MSTRLGQMLVQKKLLTADQLNAALQHQAKQGGMLGSILVQLHPRSRFLSTLDSPQRLRKASLLTAVRDATDATRAVTKVASACMRFWR